MFELRDNALVTHADLGDDRSRTLTIDFQRTLRIPDDGGTYPLPAGLGRFPLRHVDDFADAVPPRWLEHGGVMMPMHQSEALWVNFHSNRLFDRGAAYPFALRIAAGKICAVSGSEWSPGLRAEPTQNYLVVPTQPWIDGFCVGKGVIRQFVAVPLGEGFTAEEQLTGAAEHGGMQITIHPMKRDVFERRFPKRKRVMRAMERGGVSFCVARKADLGLAPGGRMKQEISRDPYGLGDWEERPTARCFVHLTNSQEWRRITGEAPPQPPITREQYAGARVPWFDYYAEAPAVDGSARLASLRSVGAREEHEARTRVMELSPPVKLRAGLRPEDVREGRF